MDTEKITEKLARLLHSADPAMTEAHGVDTSWDSSPSLIRDDYYAMAGAVLPALAEAWELGYREPTYRANPYRT